jgi:hypothetical protein
VSHDQQKVEALFESGVSQFGDSALMHLFVAAYQHVYRSNRHKEMMHLRFVSVGVFLMLVLWCGQARYARLDPAYNPTSNHPSFPPCLASPLIITLSL